MVLVGVGRGDTTKTGVETGLVTELKLCCMSSTAWVARRIATVDMGTGVSAAVSYS